MYAHCVIQPLNSLQVQFDLPPEFTDCRESELIVLPIKPARLNESGVGSVGTRHGRNI